MAERLDRNTVKKYGSLELMARQMVEGFITGLHKSPYRGFSVEFAEHKIYNTGESTRNIDWKLFARTDRLYTKSYEEETNLRCQILVDISGSMFYPKPGNDKLVFSILASAGLCYLLHRQRDAVGVSTFGSEIGFSSICKSSGTHLNFLLEQLNEFMGLEKGEEGSKIAQSLHLMADKMNRRSLIVLFSDMFEQGMDDELFAALRHLKYNHHEVILFHLADRKTEDDFLFDDRPYEFIDLESGKQVKLNPADVRERYTQLVKERNKLLVEKCAQFKIDFVPVDTAQPIDQILMPYLAKRAKLG